VVAPIPVFPLFTPGNLYFVTISLLSAPHPPLSPLEGERIKVREREKRKALNVNSNYFSLIKILS
jgi:hypothetical protein